MFEYDAMEPEYHATYSIQLCELVNAGFDPFGDERYKNADWYSDEQRERFEQKFLMRFWYREVGLVPVKLWRDKLTSLICEQMPKYKVLYAAIADGVNILADTDEYGKNRDVYSAFPATQLNTETQDYAKSANDHQFERIVVGNYIDTALKLEREYNDVDVMLLNDCEEVFSCMMSATLPAM